MNHYRLKKIDAFQKKMALLEKADTLESIEVIGVFVVSAIQAASKKPLNLDPDDVIDHLNEVGMECIAPMMVALQDAQPEEDKSRNAVGKSNK